MSKTASPRAHNYLYTNHSGYVRFLLDSSRLIKPGVAPLDSVVEIRPNHSTRARAAYYSRRLDTDCREVIDLFRRNFDEHRVLDQFSLAEVLRLRRTCRVVVDLADGDCPLSGDQALLSQKLQTMRALTRLL